MRNRIKECIIESQTRIFGIQPTEVPAFTVEAPSREDHGDFASNVAMLLTRKLGLPPRQVAQKLADDLAHLDFIDRVEVAGPGFINFFVQAIAWRKILVEILTSGADYGRGRAEKPERVMVEFVSANPTGPLHFGHGRGAVVGDVLSNLLEYIGHRVQREFYVNDAGAQVTALAQSVVCRLREQQGLPANLPADGYKGAYVAELARHLPPELTAFLPGEPDEATLLAIKDFAVAAMRELIQQDLTDFGVWMDHFAGESEILKSGRLQETFQELGQRGVLEERDGARWFLSDRFGDEKARVLVKSDGSHTYFATDVAYHLDKLRRGFERMINIWGADHHGYVPRMKAALEALGHPPEKLEVILVQMVSLLRDGQPVTMSKRAGEITTLREVFEEVGRDAARFFFLLRGVDSQMEFDLELAKQHSLENPVFYVQYGHARLSSILAKATERGFSVPEPQQASAVDLGPLDLPEELRLIRKMASFPDVVRRAAEARAPHLLVFFLQNLVADFHHYYTAFSKTRPILGGSPEQVAARLVFVQALRQVLRCALRLLGVNAPDRMETPGELGRDEK